MNETYEKIKNRYINEVNIYDYYNPYRIKENIEPFLGGIPIIFITTPSMNIFDGGLNVHESLINANSVFELLGKTDRNILKQLEYANGGSSSPFIKICTNRFKGLNIKDFNMKTVEDYENYVGWKQILPASNNENFTAETSLSINFFETKNLDITKIFYSWMSYIEAVRIGLHEPSQETMDNRILDFTSSVYFFLLDFDMRTILYFSKYVGVYPTTVPLSSLVLGDITTKNIIETNIMFTYQYKEEFNPQIIYDFNIVSKNPAQLFLNISSQQTMAVTDSDNKKKSNRNQAETMSLGSYDNNYVNKSMDDIVIDSTAKYNNILNYNTRSKKNMIAEGEDGRDFLYNTKYKQVSIKSMSEGDYVSESQTAFNSAENNSKVTFILDFDSTDNKASTSNMTTDSLATEKFKSDKWDKLRKSLLQQAVDNSTNLKMNFNLTNVNREEYDTYLSEQEKKIEELTQSKTELEKLKEEGTISEADYLNQTKNLDEKINDINEKKMSYEVFSNQPDMILKAKQKQWDIMLKESTLGGKPMIASSLREYEAMKKSEAISEVGPQVDTFIKTFQRFL